jgi:hypothetical protein
LFQILALENLDLSATQIGLAVGLGAVSIPVQLLAARPPPPLGPPQPPPSSP